MEGTVHPGYLETKSLQGLILSIFLFVSGILTSKIIQYIVAMTPLNRMPFVLVNVFCITLTLCMDYRESNDCDIDFFTKIDRRKFMYGE